MEELCITCGNVRSLCPGHFGHIELCVPVYHPLFFSKLLQLLKLKCWSCHKFRLSERQCQLFEIKLGLVDVGRAGEALGLEEKMAGLLGKMGGGVLASGSNKEKRTNLNSYSEAMDVFLNQQRTSLQNSSSSQNTVSLTMHERSLRRKILKEFASACTQCVKCQNCGGFSPKIRQDQFNKVFLVGMPKKNVKVRGLVKIVFFRLPALHYSV